jgi:ferredoxin
MSQASSESSKVFLRSPEDWEIWETQFKTQAIDLQLWDHISHSEPLLQRPQVPDIGRYRASVQPRGSARGGRSRTIDDDNDEGSSQGQSITYSDLSELGRNAYQIDIHLFTQRESRFKEQLKSIQTLRKWTMDTVAPHFVQVACKPEDTLNQWYNNLKRHVGISDTKGLLLAHEKYREALRPLTKIKEWPTWLMMWEKAMLLAEEKSLPEVLTTPIWTKEFFAAMTPVANHWVTSIKISYKAQIEQGLLTFRDLANDFREYMESNTQIVNQRNNSKVAKGVFGPTYAGQDTPDQSTPEDAQDRSAEVATSRRRNKGPLGKRGVQDEEASSEDSCVACGLPHPLSRCYYVFPEKAPNWFKGKQKLRALVDRELTENSTLIEQVKIIKGKRTRQEPSRSGSRSRSQRASRTNTPRKARESQDQDQPEE